jgi:hypothetical protein
MADAKQTAPPTLYYVMVKVIPLAVGGEEKVGANTWTVVGAPVEAHSQAEAIKAAADPTKENVYIAVPDRSFRPTKVAPKTTVQLELTEVKP